MPTTATKEKTATIASFTIEIDTHSNCDVMLQSIQGGRLRSHWSAAKLGLHVDKLRVYAEIGEIPGMRVRIIPEECAYEISDPISEKEADRLGRVLAAKGVISRKAKFKAHQTRKESLASDIHRFKTLVRELVCLLENNQAKVVKGVKPSREDVNEMPGYYLQNPNSEVSTTQPRYEKDMPAWIANLNRMGA